MFTTHQPTVLFNNASFAWPDGTGILRDASASFGAGRTGIVGANGTGKSTLLRLITGQLTPTAGTVTASTDLSYLPQHLTLDTEATLADLLGIRHTVDALRAIESGDVAIHHFETLGDDWDVDTRAQEALRLVGLGEFDLDRSVGELSGGESILAALAGLRLANAPIVLLDEPTNNLDRAARHRLYAMIRSWKGALVVVSHDTALLDLMDDIAELNNGALAVSGGNYTAYREHLEQEQDAAARAVRSAEQVLKTEKRQRIEAETKLARRSRYARSDFENKRAAKILMNQRKSNAQVSAGRLSTEADSKVDSARDALDEQSRRIRTDKRIRIELPDPGVASTRRLAELHDAEHSIVIQGPERVALTGGNGVGKSRLLDSLVGPVDEERGAASYGVALTERIGYLAQRLDSLDDQVTVLESVRAAAPNTPPGEVRASLARFLFRGDAVDRPVGQLSGGERFRVALARLLLADPPSQLLILDEPTNSLDLNSVDELVDALAGYRGGLLIVSHDDAFLERLGITRWLALDAGGCLTEGR